MVPGGDAFLDPESFWLGLLNCRNVTAPFASSSRVLLSTRPVLSTFVFQLVHLRLKGLPLFFHRLRHCAFQVSIKQLRQAQRQKNEIALATILTTHLRRVGVDFALKALVLVVRSGEGNHDEV